ncbi:MAG: tyrosine--tRNA ligase [Candidatus Aenigmarchaeota archaeon]|nr:tyrosine--tRNA ligase [Candidatus Aenigmarchaeota archaeon]
MDAEAKLNLIKRNTQEIVTEEELVKVLQKKTPIVYCGYEPNGPMHLGHFVTITKLMDFEKAGFKVKILLADIHALLNRKGEEEKIKKDVESWRKTIKAIGLKAEVVLGSDFEFEPSYVKDVMNIAQETTLNRGMRSMQEVARDFDNATISQMWYPLMQIQDIKALKCDVAYGGMEQRKIHMLGRELSNITNHKFVAVHTPLITSLKGPGEKMSKSIPGSFVSVTDSDEQIKSIIKNAYCPEKVAEDNPMLQITKLIIFPRIKELIIERPTKFGGTLKFKTYEELEETYVQGKLHPLDLKNAVSGELIKIITPIRKLFNK